MYVEEKAAEEVPHEFTAFVEAVAKEYARQRLAPRTASCLNHPRPVSSHRIMSEPTPSLVYFSSSRPPPIVCALGRCNIREIKPPLIAWCAYIVDQIASVGNRMRGKKVCELARGDLADHNKWNKGISRALKFMKDKKKCPTRNVLILGIQKKKKKKA